MIGFSARSEAYLSDILRIHGNVSRIDILHRPRLICIRRAVSGLVMSGALSVEKAVVIKSYLQFNEPINCAICIDRLIGLVISGQSEGIFAIIQVAMNNVRCNGPHANFSDAYLETFHAACIFCHLSLINQSN